MTLGIRLCRTMASRAVIAGRIQGDFDFSRFTVYKTSPLRNGTDFTTSFSCGPRLAIKPPLPLPGGGPIDSRIASLASCKCC